MTISTKLPLRHLLLSCILLAAATRALAPMATAQGLPDGAPNGAMRDFQLIGDYVLVIAGKQVPADIYQNPHAAAILIIASALPSPVLLSPPSNSAQTVNLMKVDRKPGGTVDLLPGSALAYLSGLEISDEGVGFKVEGKSAELKTAPALVGLHNAEEVTAHNPEYLPRAAAYNPDPQAVAALKSMPRPVRLRIFYGSWCPHCREMVPHAIKLERELKGSKIHFEYFGLPHSFGSDPNARQNAISGVPTGIVYINDKEAGRIVGTSWNTPESILLTIIKSTKG
jgi:thiol-disulfide isomerase/thioredoxin